MGFTFGPSKSKQSNSTINNTDNRTQDNSVAAQNSSVISSAGGNVSISNSGIDGATLSELSHDSNSTISGIIRSFLGQTAAENEAGRSANAANVGTLANALKSSASASGEAISAVSAASGKALKIGLPVLIVGAVVLVYFLRRK